MSKNKTLFIIAGIGLIAIGLIVWGSMNTQSAISTPMWRDSTIPCLPNGHQNAVLHIHQMISITVDGELETIPANIGINETCMAEVHTHDATGKIHVETPDVNAQRTLGDFFLVWGRPIIREGYVVKVVVNGKNVIDPASYILVEGDVISLSYTTV